MVGLKKVKRRLRRGKKGREKGERDNLYIIKIITDMHTNINTCYTEADKQYKYINLTVIWFLLRKKNCPHKLGNVVIKSISFTNRITST